jgi:hypothetical protein
MSTQKIISLLEKLKSDHILKCLGGCFPDNRNDIKRVNNDIYETIDILNDYEEKCLIIDENMIQKIRQQIVDISDVYFALYEILNENKINVKARDMMTKFYEENKDIYRQLIRETNELYVILSDDETDNLYELLYGDSNDEDYDEDYD